MSKSFLVRVIKNIKAEGYKCVVTELDKLDHIIFGMSYDHWETCVVHSIVKLRRRFKSPEIKIKLMELNNG